MRISTQDVVIVGMLLASGLCTRSLEAQAEASADEREAIVAVALDYIEGYYEANPERMARAVHADIAKRIAMPGPDGRRRLDHMGKWTLVELTRRNGSPQDVDLRDQVRILDVFGGTAMVRVDAETWVDFLQMARIDDRWIIVNVLWELRPQGQ